MGYTDVSSVVRMQQVKKPKILFLITEDWYFWSHRLSLARAVRDVGYEVLVATRVRQYGELIRKEGFKVLPIRLQRNSKNPLREIFAILELIIIYFKERPDLVHHVALKPVLYGSWVAKITRVPAVVNALAGLGFVFIAQGWKASIIRKCINVGYKIAFSSTNSKVIFQNPDDISTFLNAAVVASKNTKLIKGSGVDISFFSPASEPEGPPLVILASRMLWDKGVREYVEAAQILLDSGVVARFALVGASDQDNPAAVKRVELERWKNSGVVEWWGRCDDMSSIFGQSHVVCLPSYREGLPKVLIEAAACGRAIVTTDVPGCREIVRDGENGFLVPARDSKALANALKKLIENPTLRACMGRRGREIVVEEFSDKKVIEQTLSVYRELLSRNN